ncbi:DUF5719 family protein [Streptomyces flavofungini]|uniref:Secreted protein n=1 Tax=Streptomyces flavofungini TaxID=68200 RepID=A0ABS0XD04_9ACTN|nr:DUF5719 family protein [Streptomyces flavofungini]MBJ3810891.1 hypothetical protein [Streptomyces flavofungini]GHC62855.1 hypothetical protein GCM10010349_33500 [Streptomyces flavofungini]
MNRTTVSLIAATAALAAVTGFASVNAPDGGDDAAKTAKRLPVERTSLLCPEPSTSDLAETSYTAFTPSSGGAVSGGKAELLPAPKVLTDTHQGSKDRTKGLKPFLTQKAPGKPVTGEESGAEAPALVGSADGALAPGWTVQQTTTVSAGSGRGVQGANCVAPDTEFWFPGASTAKGRSDYIHLTNPDDAAAVVDVELYGRDGSIKADVGQSIQIQPHSSVPVLLSTLTGKPYTNITMHVAARSGRVAAAVHSSDDKLGGDWLPASTDPAPSLVLPGIPKDATSVRLVAFAPGADDADLKVRLASPTGPITPAGNETLHVKSGMTAAVDLGDVTKGEPGSLLLTPTEDAVPVVAGLRVTRGKGDKQETAFIPATSPVGARATVADNRAKGSTLSLVAPGKTGRVKVTASAGTEAGEPVTKTYTVKGGTTLAVEPPVPSGLKGSYALTLETQSGGPVHAARMLELPENGIPMFTVQTLPDDRGMVAVPEAEQDLDVLQK